MRPAGFGHEGGQAVILVVVAMSIFLIGALGLAIDGGQMYAQRQMAQGAADAAAQAGIESILNGTNATSSHPFGTGSAPIASSVCTTTDLRTPCVYARNNGFGGTSADTVTLSYPTTVSGVTLSSASGAAIEVTVQRTLQPGLIQFVGAGTSTINAKGIAGLIPTVSPYCMIVLDPTSASAFQAINGANLTLNGCALAVDSKSSSAANIVGSSVTASAINVVGGVTMSNGGTASPTPKTGAAATADPFATLPAPASGSCLYTNLSLTSGTTTLNPGTYCSGILVSNTASVTFKPGTYVINGGGMGFSGSGTVTGSGVMFYLTGTNSTYGSVTVSNGAKITFSAQTSGTYLGVVFFQDRSITSSNNASFAGGTTMQITGTLYFPASSVSILNGTAVKAYSTGIVAKQVSLTGGTNLTYDSTGQKTGLFSYGVALVQ